MFPEEITQAAEYIAKAKSFSPDLVHYAQQLPTWNGKLDIGSLHAAADAVLNPKTAEEVTPVNTPEVPPTE